MSYVTENQTSNEGISSADLPAAIKPAIRPNVIQRPWLIPGQIVG